MVALLCDYCNSICVLDASRRFLSAYGVVVLSKADIPSVCPCRGVFRGGEPAPPIIIIIIIIIIYSYSKYIKRK